MKTLKSTLVTLLCYPLFVLLTVILISINCGEQNGGSTPEQLETTSHEEGVIHLSKDALSKIVIETVNPEYKILKKTITVTGKVLPNQNREALIGSLIGGSVKEVFANLGDFVKKGDILLTLESLEIGEIKGQYFKAKSDIVLTEASYNRLDKLYKQEVVSLKSALEAKAAFEKAKASLTAAEMDIIAIGMSIEELEKEYLKKDGLGPTVTLRAPISGIVTERNVIIGQNVEPSEELMHIIDLSIIWVDGQVYEKDLSEVSEGREIIFTVPAWPENRFIGTIQFFNKVLDPATRTVKVRAEIKNPEGKLLPEMYGDVIISTNQENEALTVPSKALLHDNDHYIVFIIGDEPGEFRKIEVKMGRTVDSLTEILEGLEINAMVITTGAFSLFAESQKGSFGEGHIH